MLLFSWLQISWLHVPTCLTDSQQSLICVYLFWCTDNYGVWFPRRKTNYSNFEFIFENCLLVQKIDCRSRSVRILINSKRPVNCSKRTRITRAHNEKNITALWHSTPNRLGCVLLTSNAIKPRVQLFEGRLYSASLRLNFNPGFFFFCSKAFSGRNFIILFRASTHQIIGKKN